jgi:tetratricopeptide (TPR) repeat protein
VKQGQGPQLARAQRDALRVVELALTWKPGHPGLSEQASKLRAARPAPPLPASMGRGAVGAPEPIEDAKITELDAGDSAIHELDELDEVEEVEELDELDEIDAPDSAFDDVADVDPDARRPEPSNTMTKQVMSSLEARATLEPAVASGGLDHDKILQEARVLVKYRLFDHALSHLRELLADAPSHELALELEAEANAALGRVDEAAATRVRLARSIMERDRERALTLLRGALDLVPGHARALELSEALGGSSAAGGESEGDEDFIDLEEAPAKPVPAPRARAMTPVAPPEQQAMSARASLEAVPAHDPAEGLAEEAVGSTTIDASFDAPASHDEPLSAAPPARPAEALAGDARETGAAVDDDFELDDGISTPPSPPVAETIRDDGTDGDGLVLGLADPDLVGDLRHAASDAATADRDESGSAGAPDDLGLELSGPIDGPIDDELGGLSAYGMGERQPAAGLEDSSGDFAISLQEDAAVAAAAAPEPVEDRFGLDDDVTTVIQVGPPGPEDGELGDGELDGEGDDASSIGADAAGLQAGEPSAELSAHAEAAAVVEAVVEDSEPLAAAGASRADLSDELEELEFFLSQDLDDDARAAYDDLAAKHPGHPSLVAIAIRLGLVSAEPDSPAHVEAGADVDAAAAATPAEADEGEPGAEAASSMDHELIGSIVADEAQVELMQDTTDAAAPAAAPLVSFEDEDDDSDFLSSIFDDGATATKKKEVKHRAVANVSDADAATNYDLGTAYFGMGLLDDASKALDSAARDPVWRARAMIMLGSVKRQAGDLDAAVEAYQEAADSATSPDERSEASYELGATLEQRGETGAAIAAFEEVSAGFRDRDARIAALKEG